MAFFTITIAPGISRGAHRRAVRDGPRAVAARRDTPSLLHQAGFADVSETNVTQEFLETAANWLSAAERNRVELRPTAPEVFDEQQRDRRLMLRAIEDGLLCRSLLMAVRPE